ncbi:MAG TPA: DNA polymerase IV [Thermoclostridium sp.]
MEPERVIFHIDVNSAFLSWEALEQLKKGSETDLRTVPAIVAGDPSKRHGVVLAKSIPAKKYGIVTGEPVVKALKKCPAVIIVPPNHEAYARYSKAMTDLLRSFTPDIEKYSIDECFVDVTGLKLKYKNDFLSLAHMMKNRIRDELGFTVNIGISENKLLAKMASDFKKPDLVHTLFRDEIQQKMWPLPVSELFMVGRASSAKFQAMGIKTIGDLAKSDVFLLEHKFGKYGRMIWEYANGIDDSAVQTEESEAKDLSNETTVEFDITDRETARLYLLALSETVGMRLRKAGLYAGVIAVNLKNNNFESYSCRKKIDNPTQDTNVIFETATHLFDKAWRKDPLRLIGVATSVLVKDPVEQLSMFNNLSYKQSERKKLNESIDRIREKYGSKYIVRGSLLNFNKDFGSKDK